MESTGGNSGDQKTLFKNSKEQRYEVSVLGDATFQINTFYFPGWRVFVDGEEVSVDPTRSKDLGLMLVDLTQGRHEVVARFTNTPIRTLGNSLSVVSWLILIVFVLKLIRVSVSTLRGR